MANIPTNAKYPDAIAIAYDETNMKLTCVYNDHSLYVWDVGDIKRVCVKFIIFYFCIVSDLSLINLGRKIKFIFVSFGMYLGCRNVPCFRRKFTNTKKFIYNLLK